MSPAHTIALTSSSSTDTPDTTKFRIRDARPDDCLEIYQMICQLAKYTNMTEKLTITAEQLKQDGFGDGHLPRYFAIVIERMDQTGTHPLDLIGYSIYNEKYSTWKGRILWIEDIYICEPYQKYSLGSAVLRMLASIASKSTMDRIEWCVSRCNRDAIAFYDSIGSIDLTNTEDWQLYCFNADKYKEYLAKPFARTETIKIL